METTITKKQLLTFLMYAKQYISKFPKERSQLTFALQTKFIDKNKKLVEEIEKSLQEKREELEAKHCLKDKDGSFIERDVKLENGQVLFRKSFTIDGDKKRKEEYDTFEESLLSEAVDIKPYYVDIPVGIDITWVREFTGFVFKEMTPEEEEKWYLSQANLVKPQV